MPGKHSEKTTMLGFYADLELAAALDKARGSKSRSQFMREAAIEGMRRLGVVIPAHLANAPDRTGKGGPKPKATLLKYPDKKADAAALNDSVSSDQTAKLTGELSSGLAQEMLTPPHKPAPRRPGRSRKKV